MPSAMVEIDDYKNYEKALGALNEALKCMSKAKMKDFNAQERRVSTLQERIEVVKKFTAVKRLAVESPPDMLVEARRLLDEPDLDEVVRLGDVSPSRASLFLFLFLRHLLLRSSFSQLCFFRYLPRTYG